jgi:hypothetical protein
VVLIVLSTRSLVKEMFELSDDVLQYFWSPDLVWNLADISSLILTGVTVYRVLSHQHRGLTAQIAAVATFCVWFRTIKHLSGFESSAKYVQMFLQVWTFAVMYHC